MRICLQQQRKGEFKGSHNAAENSQARSKLKILLVQYEMFLGGFMRMLDILQVTFRTRLAENPLFSEISMSFENRLQGLLNFQASKSEYQLTFWSSQGRYTLWSPPLIREMLKP